MFTTLFSLSLLVTLIPSVLAQSDDNLTVYTPLTFNECQQVSITWSDTGNSPYEVFVVPDDNPCDTVALMYLGNQTSTSVTCTPDISAGTQVDILVVDAAGNEGWSATITVGGSNDTSCLTSNSPSGGISGTLLTPGTPTSSPSASTTFSPVGAAGAGLVSNWAVSTSPLSSVTLLGSAVLAVVVLTL
ncbi:hypothetical protein V8E55_003735 [Tylopilus felleus]